MQRRLAALHNGVPSTSAAGVGVRDALFGLHCHTVVELMC